MQLIVPVAHISCFDFNLETIKRLDYMYEVHLSLKVILCRILEKEIRLRIVVDQLKDLLMKKSQMDFNGLFTTVDIYSDDCLNPDK